MLTIRVSPGNLLDLIYRFISVRQADNFIFEKNNLLLENYGFTVRIYVAGMYLFHKSPFTVKKGKKGTKNRIRKSKKSVFNNILTAGGRYV